jgi:cellulose synthase/poly-beta-1,6-N-acetylglucosamine synthase-like glycosyltransferase
MVLLLQSVIANNYPRQLYEILVVDDFSDDDTAIIASAYLQDKNGRVISLKEHLTKEQRINAYKKKALEIAIQQAKGDLIVTTDADCIVPENWLQHIVMLYEKQNAKFIAAPVIFINDKKINRLLYYFQSLDFMTMQGITAATAALRVGDMCNGANLAFDKAAYDAVQGYEGIDHIASGDDMLLMEKIHTAYPDNIAYLKSQEAIVATQAQASWKDFLNQRIRWSSKADQYRNRKMFGTLLLVYLFNLNFLVLLIAGAFDFYFLKLCGILFIAKIITELIFLVPVAIFYRKQQELLLFPLLQPLHIGYVIIAGFLGKFGKYEWKGRVVQ